MTRSALVNWTIGFVLIFLLWYMGHLAWPRLIPSPFQVITAIFSEPVRVIANSWQTAIEAIGGLLLSCAGALLLVVLVGTIPRAEAMVLPSITLLKAAPAVVFVPLFVNLLGVGTGSKVLVSALISFFPIVLGGFDGLKRMPERLALMARVYGARGWRSFSNLSWGYAVSGFLSGLKTAAPLSVVGAIVGEYVAGGNPEGLGTYIMTSNVTGDQLGVFEGMVMAAMLGITFFAGAHLAASGTDKLLHLAK